MKLRTEYIDDGSSFFEVIPAYINPECLAQFAIFERTEIQTKTEKAKYRFRCLLFDTGSIAKEKLVQMLQTWSVIYVHKEQKNIYDDYVRENLPEILNNNQIDIKNRTEIFKTTSLEVIGETFQANFSRGQLDTQIVKRIGLLVNQAVGFISTTNSLNGLARLIGHDYDTHLHSIKVGWLMATFINANRDLFSSQNTEFIKKLITYATVVGFLHDIGKVKIPKSVINKNGKLDNLEFIAVQAHTAYSVSLLFENNLPKASFQGILYHHENEDGSGYPCGISGDQIPILAKICHIADVFDALTSRRSYKEPKSVFDALKIMSGLNPHIEVLQRLEAEVMEFKKTPVTAIVRNEDDKKIKELREKDIIAREAQKRVEVRAKLRDKGMSHCFNSELLKRFIVTLNKSDSFDLTDLT